MDYKASDIEIFVLTYNRANYLKETLTSLINQSIQGFDIIVLDNASTDHTSKMIEEIDYPNLKYIQHPKNIMVYGNFVSAQNIASKEWAIVFHDDDLMHPNYIEEALQYLNKWPDLVLLISQHFAVNTPNINIWKEVSSSYEFFKTVKDFARFLYSSNNCSLPSTIYKCQWFKEIPIYDYQEVFGKIADRPDLLNVAENGSTVLLYSPFIQCRLHEGQDSQNNDNGPFHPEIINLNKLFHEILGSNMFTIYGRTFIRYNLYHLLWMNHWGGNKKRIHIFRYIFEAYRKRAATITSILYGLFPFKNLFGRLFNKILFSNKSL